MNDGQLLSETAVDAYRKQKSKKLGHSVYGGLYWNSAVGQAMAKGVKSGKKKDRRQVAEELTAKIFDKARGCTQDRLNRIASCVGPNATLISGTVGVPSELEIFAAEVHDELVNEDIHNARMGTGPEDLVSGLVDIGALISLIMGIISAIRACKNPTPIPVPTPVPTPA